MEEKIRILQKCMVFHKGKLLIIQRNINDSLGGKWEFPGGNLEFLEKMDDGIIREIKEETGLSAKNIERIGVAEIIDKTKAKHFLLFLYKTNVNGDEIKLSEEHQDYEWINPCDLFNRDLSPIFNSSKELIKKILTEFR